MQNHPNSSTLIVAAEFNSVLALAQWFMYLITHKLSLHLSN